MTWDTGSLLSLALWLAGAGHFVTLGAGLQAPHRLGWVEDFAKLRPFNRKIFWTYYGFTGGTIVAFGCLTLALHDEMLRGDRAALALAGFIAAFWTARITVDFFYFDHDDWPPGALLKIGHVLLTSLFIAMAGTYFGLVAFHVL